MAGLVIGRVNSKGQPLKTDVVGRRTDLLIVVLLKGVPARTTQVVQVGGVLNREVMDLVLNPHDMKAVEAADFLKRRIGGKAVAITMGPDAKLIPLMKPLFDSEVLGIDEEYVLSDRKMAGADTLATSYAVSFGVKKLLETHTAPLNILIEAIQKAGYSDAVRAKAIELYRSNLISNRVFSELPSVKESLIQLFLNGSLTAEETVHELENEKARLSKFIIVSGTRTTDGETGSVGPQVAEGVSELLGVTLPHATYVEDFDVDPRSLVVTSQRLMGPISQKLEMQLPALLTIATDYRPREPTASTQKEVRLNSYRGKVRGATKWTADDLGADPKRLGLAGSPTIVGTGIEVGKPPVQKFLGKSLVFGRDVQAFDSKGTKFGPFSKGDLASGLPAEVLSALESNGSVVPFSYQVLAGEPFS
jgi:electron transfer flavoprotein beta subunit